MQPQQPPNLTRLGEIIRDQRKALNLTQAQLAERLGWSQERISTLENGKYGLPSLPLLAHLSQAVELPLATLMEAVGFQVGGVATAEYRSAAGRSGDGMEAILSYTLQRLLGIQALTLKDAMNQASDLMGEAMGADKIDVFIYEPETRTLVALGTSNTPMGRQQLRSGLNRVPIANGGRQVEVFQTGKEYYTGHGDQDPELDRGVVHTLGVRSLYAVPLRVEGRTRGIIVAESVHPERFSQAERDFFEAASRWVGMVAHRAELHEQITRRSVAETRRMVVEEMLAMVAHDLGNQITPIQGRLELLLHHLQGEQNERDAAEVATISASMDRLSRMVNDLLDASRLEGGIFSLSCRPTNLVPLVREVVEVARHDRSQIDVRGPDQLLVEVDPARVTQAFQTLVGNAVQHAPEGGAILVSLGQEQREDGAYAIVAVHDEGPGMAPELLPQLFTRHADGEDGMGLGVGLYLARGIATAHGGELTVESEPGSGTTFTLTFPIQDDFSEQ